MRKTLNKMKFFFSCLIMMALLCVPCYASEETTRVVRVGYFDLGNYYKEQRDGTVQSYDSAFLSKISEYTNLKFEYVDCGTWDGALAKMEKHEIDLVGTMHWTDEREAKYAICDASYGYSVAELAALSTSDYIYQDYEGMSGAIIGCIKGYVIEDEIPEMLRKHGISADVITYSNQTALDSALENGEIDLIAANAHAMHDDWKIVDKFAYSPFYFASYKENEALTKEISEAIIRIEIHESDFADNLMREYFPRMVNSPYNKLEMDLVNKGIVYNIYFDENTLPVVWYDKETDSMKGALTDVCRQLEQITGLKFELRKKSDNKSPDNPLPTTVTYRTLNYRNDENASQNDGVTNSILDQNFALYHRVNDSYQVAGAYKIGVMEDRDGLEEYIRNKYPQCEMKHYATPKDCMIALQKKEIDLTLMDSNIAENVLISNALDDITEIPMSNVSFGIALEFYGENAEALAGIVDKGIKLLDETKIEDAMVQYALETSPEITLIYLIRRNLGMFVAILICLLIVLLLIFGLFLYARLMREERIHVEKMDKERSDFFARMSHDMRTPMNGILGMIELTEQTEDMEEVRSNMNKARASSKYMLSLINDTLDIQRLESGKLQLNLQVVECGVIIDEMQEMFRSSTEQKGVELRVIQLNTEGHVYLRMDPVRVKQIFTNLVSNAVKFTPSGGVVEVRVEHLKTENNRFYESVCIKDSGVGMTREFIDKNLFTAYSQEQNEFSGQYAGSGLGLAITKNLVECMAGKIEVASEPGEGTMFTVYLDFEIVESGEVLADISKQKELASRVEIELQNKRVLLCEDHPMNAEIVTRLLDKVGCEVTHAKNGKEGVDMFAASKEQYFDAVLMDIRMPVMDGIEATKQIRALERVDAKLIPVIALSANAYDEDIRICKEAGMNLHLSKPIEPKVLYETLSKLIAITEKEK